MRFLRKAMFAFATATVSANAGIEASIVLTLPTVVEAPRIGSAMSATVMPLHADGYVEEEYFIHGKANRYRITDPPREAQYIDSNPYVTRALVRRPVDAAHFNGTVIIEWLNVSLDQDIDFVFGATRELLVRDG